MSGNGNHNGKDNGKVVLPCRRSWRCKDMRKPPEKQNNQQNSQQNNQQNNQNNTQNNSRFLM